MFEAVYISNNTNEQLVYEYLVKLASPTYASLRPLLSAHDGDVPVVEINPTLYVVYEEFAQVTVWVLCSSAAGPLNPIAPFVFIHRVFAVIKDYYGAPVSATKIEANSDSLTMVLAEMLDTAGMPRTTDGNQLRDLVPHQSFLSKLLGSNSAAEILSEVSSSSFPRDGISAYNQLSSRLSAPTTESPVPWRRSHVKYTNNEMYVDVVEEINVIFQVTHQALAGGNAPRWLSSSSLASSSSPSGLRSASAKLVPVVASVDGHLNFLSHLTGVPELSMTFNHVASSINVPSLHRCIDVGKWEKQCSLSFIPPDGTSKLMSYQLELPPSAASGVVEADYQPRGSGEFELRLFVKPSPEVAKIDAIKVSITCAESQTVKSSRCTHGDFGFKGHGLAEWTLKSVSSGVQPLLQAQITDIDDDTDTDPVSEGPLYISISYEHKGAVPSGLKVDSLKIVQAKGMPDSVKPFKGVKYITRTGQYVIRP
ncbi:AP-3 complex subunit mu [Diutina catenulata]